MTQSGKARCFPSGGIYGNNLLWVSGKIVCKQMNSSRSSGRKDERGTGHCSERTKLWIPANFSFFFFYAPLFKRASFYLLGIPLLKQSLFFPPLIRSFISGGKKTQNQVPRSALVAKSERAAASFFSLSRVWALNRAAKLALVNGRRREKKKTFNRIRGRLCSRNLLLKQVETGPCSLYK